MLGEALERIADFDEEYTVYAATPFSLTSQALVELESYAEENETAAAGGVVLPPKAKDEGLAYFLEVHLIKDIVGTLSQHAEGAPDVNLKLEAVQYYREHDAYMPADIVTSKTHPEDE
jgi:hypothetical protein